MKPVLLNYLPHLDGLRALAFTYVLLFHFRVFGAAGGYLGVDIFLVLSGFLMTRIILRDIRTGMFTMFRFMTRRFWRLYPSLLATVACTLTVSLVLFSPKIQKAVGASSAAALLFGSNLYFQWTTGYFDIGNELKPLLHTWSLSLEEQFYIVWPLILFLVYHYGGSSPKKFPVALLAAMGISFAVAWKSWRRHSFTFFGLPSRIFEFAFGGFLSLYYDNLTHIMEKGGLHHAMSIIGAVLVNYPVFIAPRSNLPGPSSLMTLSGTALLLLSPSSAISKYCLASSPARFIGKLSYAGYLVHWPVWVYYLFMLDTDGTSNINKPMLFFITLVLACILHSCVENPFRHKRSIAKTVALLTVLAATLCLTYISTTTQGLPMRTKKDNYNLLAGTWQYNAMDCRPVPHNHILFRNMTHKQRPRTCYIGRVHPKNVNAPLPISHIIVGSSFSYHLIPAFRLLALRRNESYLFLHHESCPLLASKRHSWPWVTPACYRENRRRMNLLNSMPSSSILVADYWVYRFLMGARSPEEMYTGEKGSNLYFRSLCNAMSSRGHRLTVLGDPPVVGEVRFEGIKSCHLLRDMRVRLWWRAVFGGDGRCATRFPLPRRQNEMRKRHIRFFKQDKDMRKCGFYDQFPSFCDLKRSHSCMVSLPEKRKMVAPEGVRPNKMTDLAVYWEGVHLNNLGAWQASVGLNELLDAQLANVSGQ